MTAKIIINPYAGRWKGKSSIPAIQSACAEVGLDYEMVSTEGPGHATELAREAVLAGFSPIIAAGGDGTIGEIVNGMLQASGGEQPQAPLGVIPLGTADDFPDNLKMHKETTAACQVIVDGYERVIDLGLVNGRYFDNNSAVGLEPMVSIAHEKMVRLKGIIRYLVAALKAILTHHPWHMRLEWDGGEFEGPVTLVSVGNTPRTGGLFYMTPKAEPDDGKLDFCFAGQMSRLKLLLLLPKTFDGSHIERPDVYYERTTRLTISCDPSTPIQADGELFELAATQITYEALPARLKVLVPAPSTGPAQD